MTENKIKIIEKLEKSKFLNNAMLKLTRTLHFEVLNEDFKWHAILSAYLVLVIYAFTSYVYNLQKFWGDFDFVIFSTILTAPIISAGYRLYNWPDKHELVYDLYNRFIDMDRKYQNNAKFLKIVKKYNVFLNLINTLLISLLFVVCVALLLSPAILHIVFNLPWQLPLPLLLIEIDATTNTGFILTYIYQVIAITLCVWCFTFVQPLNVMYTGLVTCMIEILRAKVQAFEQILLIKDEKRMKTAFVELIDYHNEIIDVASDVEEVLSFQLFLDITVFSVGVVIALFYAKVYEWYAGYVMAGSIVLAGFINHFLGELATIQMEKLAFDIYNVSWYRMDVSMQRSWKLILQRSQESQLFTCAGLKPVGIDTFSSFINSIYSYFLLLNDLITTFK